MKRNYKTPLTEVIALNTSYDFQQEQDDPTQDSTGTVSGQDPGILVNETFFDEEEAGQAKSFWD